MLCAMSFEDKYTLRLEPAHVVGVSHVDLFLPRYHGTVEIGKVAGNFHVTAGRSIPFPRGHAHLALMIDDDAYNFSHRIDEFSFGERTPGKINPLDGDLKVTKHHRHTFQYFLQGWLTVNIL